MASNLLVVEEPVYMTTTETLIRSIDFEPGLRDGDTLAGGTVTTAVADSAGVTSTGVTIDAAVVETAQVSDKGRTIDANLGVKVTMSTGTIASGDTETVYYVTVNCTVNNTVETVAAILTVIVRNIP